MTRLVPVAVVLAALALHGVETAAVAGQPSTFPLRGKSLTITVYQPATPPKGTIIMGSGDVGWVGLGVSLAEFLSGEGYIVAGVNVRQYLSTFTVGKTHLVVTDPPS